MQLVTTEKKKHRGERQLEEKLKGEVNKKKN